MQGFNMIGSFLTRGLVMVFGYAYPAYECFKTVEMNKPDIQELRFWCQYWILVALLTVCERFGDAFVSWVPMYSEAKLAFIIYLWCPKTKGTTYVYDSFFKPVVLKHEPEIDRNLLELRTRAGDMAFLYWQNAASYVQTTIRSFDILQFVGSQSTPRPTQPQKQNSKGRQRTVTPPKRRPVAPATKVQTEKQASPASTESSSENEADATKKVKLSQPPPVAAPAAAASALNAQKTTPTEALTQTTKAASSSSETQVMQIDRVPSLDNQSAKPPVDTVMEEPVRVTRARSRRTRAAPSP